MPVAVFVGISQTRSRICRCMSNVMKSKYHLHRLFNRFARKLPCVGGCVLSGAEGGP